VEGTSGVMDVHLDRRCRLVEVLERLDKLPG